MLLDPVQYPGAMKAFAREVCRNDLLNFGRLHFFFPDSRMSLDLNTDKTLKVTIAMMLPESTAAICSTVCRITKPQLCNCCCLLLSAQQPCRLSHVLCQLTMTYCIDADTVLLLWCC